MELVDTHCHIQSAGLKRGGERTTQKIWATKPELTGDVLVKNAVQKGVTNMLVVGCDLSDSQLAIQFAQKHAECHASIGRPAP
jgi:Tat protein secretion system quality control protein TatD with DNase activity